MRPMKVIYLILILFSLNIQARTTIIADLDDTIKIINSGNYITIGFNALFRNRVFTGMPEFLNESRSYSDELHVVSASPWFIRQTVVKTLRGREIEYEKIVLKSFRGLFESKYSFKLRKMRQIIEASDDDIVLLGDDVSYDPIVYDVLMRSYPDRVLASYIHVIKGKTLPDTAIPHWTSFELAAREYEAGRMDEESVLKIFELTLKENRMSRLIPGFAHCPTTDKPWEWMKDTVFSDEASQISQKIVNYCR